MGSPVSKIEKSNLLNTIIKELINKLKEQCKLKDSLTSRLFKYTKYTFIEYLDNVKEISPDHYKTIVLACFYLVWKQLEAEKLMKGCEKDELAFKELCETCDIKDFRYYLGHIFQITGAISIDVMEFPGRLLFSGMIIDTKLEPWKKQLKILIDYLDEIFDSRCKKLYMKEKWKKITFKCLNKILEDYATRYKIPTKHFQIVGLVALQLVYTNLGLEDLKCNLYEDDVEDWISSCDPYNNIYCTKQLFLDYQRHMLKFVDYTPCRTTDEELLFEQEEKKE